MSEISYEEKMADSRRKHLEFAKALADNTETLRNQLSRTASVNQRQLTNYLANPLDSYLDISKLMNALYAGNGIIKQNINYHSTILTLNHSIYPAMNDKSGYDISKFDQTDFVMAANFVKDLKIKRFAPHFIRQTFMNGYSLFYKIQDRKGIAYLEFPIRFGRIYAMEDGVYRWAVDVDALSGVAVESMPAEIAKAMQSSNKNDDNWIEGKYFKLKDKGVAFCFDQNVLSNGGIAVSEFSNLIGSALKLENARNKLEIKDDLDNIKLIHSQIPVDKDGRPQMEVKIAAKYDKSMRTSLPKGVVPITNPMKVTNIALNGAGDTKAYESVSRATASLFYDMGTPSPMFGGATTSSNIVKISNLKDVARIYSTVLPAIEDYYNYEMSKYKSPTSLTWKVKIMRQSQFTYADDLKDQKEQLSLGGSRWDFLAMSGMEPIELAGKLAFEQQIMDIDNLMYPKQTSHTMSSGSSNSTSKGRPITNNPTDDTDRLNDAN